jgi:hypothetical protein
MCSGCFGEYEEEDSFGRPWPEASPLHEHERGNELPAFWRAAGSLNRGDEFEVLVGTDTIVEIHRSCNGELGACLQARRAQADRKARQDEHTGAESAKDYRTALERRRGGEIRSGIAVQWLWLAGVSVLLPTALALWLLAR